VRDSKYVTVGEAPAPFVYQPLLQRHESGMSLLVRTQGDAAAAIPVVRGEVQKLERNLPLTQARPMTELLAMSLFGARAGALLLGCFGLLALLLATVGLYGVMSYSVSRRTREIGIRMALGAQGGTVLRLVLREGMTLVALGVALGLAVALAATRLLTGFLYGVSPTDPAAFAFVALLLSGVALVASLLPARRAAKVDPMIALRDQ
jgi:ABC-type antimicrobial peptide transport system permease subunit